MKAPSRRIRRAVVVGASAVAAAGMIVPAVTSSAASAQPELVTSTSSGYPPPAGIYKAFTNCPLNNPVIHESTNGFTACVAGIATTGSITLGNLTTPVVKRVNVQFAFYTPPNVSIYPAPTLSPLAGSSTILATLADPIPRSLTTALGCPSSNATVEALCQKAQALGGKYNQVNALAQEAGSLSNFNLFNWTQPVKFHLINPLLGANCYVGSDDNPVVLNPQLVATPNTQLIFEPDPKPTIHPDTFVLGLLDVNAVDSTFTAPGVTGCGPGGTADIAVDEAIDSSTGLPAASGTNSLTLTGNFLIAATTASGDSSLTQPQDDAGILLSAFKDSTSGEHSAVRHITESEMQSLLSQKAG
jgi:hypothetical protein